MPPDADEVRDAAIARFAAQVDVGLPALDEAALEIAVAAEPRTADSAAALAELDRLAEGVASVDGLVHRLYTELGYAGDRENYYDPRNSSLTRVLERRRGIPITLAVVAIEVGRRAGIVLEPVGMPGHFLVHPRGSAWHLDPFTGELLDHDECEARFRASTGAGPHVAFGPDLLAPVSHEMVLARMLANLHAIHRAGGRLAELRWVLEMRMALPGVGVGEVLDLALVRARRARYREAADLLEHWALRLPDGAARLHRQARAWRAHLN